MRYVAVLSLLVWFWIACMVTSGCAWKSPTGNKMAVTPLTSAKFSTGGEISVLELPEVILR